MSNTIDWSTACARGQQALDELLGATHELLVEARNAASTARAELVQRALELEAERSTERAALEHVEQRLTRALERQGTRRRRRSTDELAALEHLERERGVYNGGGGR